MHENLATILTETAKRHGDRTAFKVDDVELSYGLLDEATARDTLPKNRLPVSSTSFEEEYGTGAGWAPGPVVRRGAGRGCASAKPIDSQTSPRARVTIRTTVFMIPLKSNLLA